MEIISVAAAIIIFGLFDYFGFHISLRKGWADFGFINPYRIAQLFVQISLSLVLLMLFGWVAVISFNILWWTWWADLIFYFFYDTLRIFGYPRSPGGFKEQVMGNKVTWAFWTPLGLLKHKGKHNVITWKELFIQSIFGLIFVICLYLFIK